MGVNHVLTGPEDPDNFRVWRGSSRWYCDPLPSCPIAEATDDAWPSISAVKKVRATDWSYVALRRVASASPDELRRIAGLDRTARYDAVKAINRAGLNIDAGRGTIVHWWGEDLLHGRDPREIDPLTLLEHDIPEMSLKIAELYKPALIDFFKTYKPKLVATEYPVIHRTLNGVGYGGTPDGLWEIAGKLYAYDFKSRGLGSKHGAYPEEAAQVAAGLTADYMIVRGPDGTAVRQPIPRVDGAMIVSIKPDGARVYPINIPDAIEEWHDLHAQYVKSLNPRKPVGRQWPVQRAA